MWLFVPKKVINCRPLVFLCGPFFDESDKNDRRTILRRSLGNQKIDINSKDVNVKIEPFALIVDNLFNNLLGNDGFNLPLVEEIIAACAYKNYIFVDTLSTALELGLFSNSFSNNTVTAFLPKDFELFKPSIGFFVTETMDKSNRITSCMYSNIRRNKYPKDKKAVIENVIAFKGKQLPAEINKQIEEDFPDKQDKYILSIELTQNIEEKEKIYFKIDLSTITFIVPTGILLYFVHSYTSEESIRSKLSDYLIYHILENEKQLLSLIPRLNQKQIDIKILTQFAAEPSEVIKCMNKLVQSIKTRIDTQKYTKLQYDVIGFNYYFKLINFYELFNFSSNTLHKCVYKFKNKSNTVKSKNIIINGKSRKITTYSGSHDGYELRLLHNNIRKVLENLIELNVSAYAYRKNHSVIECVKLHLHSRYFLKIDIKDFFSSISKSVMKLVLKAHFCDNGILMYNAYKLKSKAYIPKNNAFRISFRKRRINYKRRQYIDSWDGLSDILNFCFVNNKLPLGLACSPLMSNIYMDYFDINVSQEYPSLIYTRYSDDILISSATPFDQNAVLNYIKRELSFLRLECNELKTRRLELREIGDHVKFLGLNIVASENENYISIGKKYLIQTSILLEQYLNRGEQLSRAQIVGRIKYIKYISGREYEIFKNIFQLKTKKSSALIDKLIK